MNEIEQLTKELDSLMGETAPEKRERFNEVVARLKELNGPEVQARMKPVIEHQLSEARKEGEMVKGIMRQQMDDTTYKLIPWSYIAREYFHKTPGWLQQRINGQSVRGKVYTLNAEQKAVLDRALGEICSKIGSYRLALA